jgi:hypothetical protein
MPAPNSRVERVRSAHVEDVRYVTVPVVDESGECSEGEAGQVSTWLQHRNASRCHGCGALVIWRYTPAERLLPLDVETLDVPVTGSYVVTDAIHCRPYQPLFDEPGMHYHLSHWATCPRADEFRK